MVNLCLIKFVHIHTNNYIPSPVRTFPVVHYHFISVHAIQMAGTVAFIALSKLAFPLIFTLLCINEPYLIRGTYISTPYYPKPYLGEIPRIRVNVTAAPGNGIAVLFDQFLVGPADCVFACDTDAMGCDSLCGDVMDHHAVKKTLRTNSSTVVTLHSTGGSDGFPHSGIHGKIIEYNLKDPKFFDCNQTVVLNSSETFFLVSHNYPGTPLDFSPCTVTFQYSEGIRLALYDLVTMNTEIFTIQGTALNGTSTTINYSGRFTTYDEPVPLYFQKSVTISFKFENATTFYARRFYILVNAFTITKASSDPCNNPRHFPLQLGEVVQFGTKEYSTQTYSSNADCQFSFANSQPTNTWIGFAMSYESEKCCDTMSINGLSPYNDVYQGSQSSFLLFAASNNITMRFTSDGVIEGTGFNASAYLFDCSCGNTNIVLNSSTTSLSILSPGRNYETSYCPNMDCTYTINFPDDQYEVTAQYGGNLRKYYGSVEPDIVIFSDRYSRAEYRANPNYMGPPSMLFTVSPFQFRFVSNNVTGFPLTDFDSYFSVMNSVKKRNIISRSIQLSDSNQFADISTGGFKSDAEATYEFKISTDAEKIITIYFFTLVSGQVKVDLYDGSSTSSSLIDNKILYSNVRTEGESLPLRSTGSSMVVRVRCNTDYDRNCGHDFQAMVSSSAQQDSSCGPMVYSLKNETESKDIPLGGSNCVLILHSTDSSYDPGKVMQLKISSDKLKSLKVFKGLHFNENKYLLSSGSLESIPRSIYDHYVVVQYSASSSASITLKYFVRNFDYLSIYTINNNQSVTFMSKDYLSDKNLGRFDQQFSIENLDATLTRGNLRLVVLNSVGDAYGSIEVDNYDEIVAQKSYSSANATFTYEARGTKIVIGYISYGNVNSGLNARVEGYMPSGNNVQRISTFIIFIVTLLSLAQ